MLLLLLLQVSQPLRGLPIVAAGGLLTDEEAAARAATDDAVLERLESAAAASSSGGRPGSSKWVIDESENLKSTWEHRAWTWGCLGLLAASLGSAASGVHDASDVACAASALAAAYVLSDLGTGIYHWSVDNYGDGNTPVFGRQIAAFQGHHQRPWTITQREFCNNVHQVRRGAGAGAGGARCSHACGCMWMHGLRLAALVAVVRTWHPQMHMQTCPPARSQPACVQCARRRCGWPSLFFLLPDRAQVFKPATTPAALILAGSTVAPLWLAVFCPSFLGLVCMSQQFHAWSHMKRSELPGAVVALQDAGLLIGRKAHGAHHRPNFEGNYCIVSGLWNNVLDESGFFRKLEELVLQLTGVEPRCWYPPETDWVEQVQPGTQA